MDFIFSGCSWDPVGSLGSDKDLDLLHKFHWGNQTPSTKTFLFHLQGLCFKRYKVLVEIPVKAPEFCWRCVVQVWQGPCHVGLTARGQCASVPLKLVNCPTANSWPPIVKASLCFRETLVQPGEGQWGEANNIKAAGQDYQMWKYVIDASFKWHGRCSTGSTSFQSLVSHHLALLLRALWPHTSSGAEPCSWTVSAKSARLSYEDGLGKKWYGGDPSLLDCSCPGKLRWAPTQCCFYSMLIF